MNSGGRRAGLFGGGVCQKVLYVKSTRQDSVDILLVYGMRNVVEFRIVWVRKAWEVYFVIIGRRDRNPWTVSSRGWVMVTDSMSPLIVPGIKLRTWNSIQPGNLEAMYPVLRRTYMYTYRHNTE